MTDQKTLQLTDQMWRYDFSKSPLSEANVVIDEHGRICKNRAGLSGGEATAEQLAAAVEVSPNRG